MVKINIENCEKGFILKGVENHKHFGHYIIFYEHLNYVDFVGCMISTKYFEGKNISMSENHFAITLFDGSICDVVYNNSHLVNAKLHKFGSMGPFYLCGQLTKDGIVFLEEIIDDLKLEDWNSYIKRTKDF